MTFITKTTSLLEMAPAARGAVAAFDLDRTLVPITDQLFRRYVETQDRWYYLTRIRYNPLQLAVLIPFLRKTTKKAIVRWGYQRMFVEARKTRGYLSEYVGLEHGPKIYPRGAQELAWRRANLNTTAPVATQNPPSMAT